MLFFVSKYFSLVYCILVDAKDVAKYIVFLWMVLMVLKVDLVQCVILFKELLRNLMWRRADTEYLWFSTVTIQWLTSMLRLLKGPETQRWTTS